MSDIKLFRVGPQSASELEGVSFTVERSLQTLIERHCETFLGVTFLASEHATGKTHAGRIDTLGIDGNDLLNRLPLRQEVWKQSSTQTAQVIRKINCTGHASDA